MAFTPRLTTSLSVRGGPGYASAPLYESASVTDTLSVSWTESPAAAGVLQELTASDTLSVTLSDSSSLQTFDARILVTELSPHGGPGAYHDIGAKTPSLVVDLFVSDTLSVQWLEDPVDQNYIVTADTLRLSVSDVSAVFNRIDAIDTLSVRVSEAIALVQVGVTLITASDTLSVSVSESVALDVTLSVTDTVSVSLTDSSTVDTTVVTKTVTDTLSVTVSDASLLQVFTGLLAFDVSETLLIGLGESSSASIFVPTKPARIRIAPLTARIRITPI